MRNHKIEDFFKLSAYFFAEGNKGLHLTYFKPFNLTTRITLLWSMEDFSFIHVRIKNTDKSGYIDFQIILLLLSRSSKHPYYQYVILIVPPHWYVYICLHFTFCIFQVADVFGSMNTSKNKKVRVEFSRVTITRVIKSFHSNDLFLNRVLGPKNRNFLFMEADLAASPF